MKQIMYGSSVKTTHHKKYTQMPSTNIIHVMCPVVKVKK